MTRSKRTVPLLIDRLPLYATDGELGAAIMGPRSAEWPVVLRLFQSRGFPKINKLTGGRYVPAVLAFLDAVEGLDEGAADAAPERDFDKEVEAWNSSRRSPRRA
jgi:hypothetical protein